MKKITKALIGVGAGTIAVAAAFTELVYEVVNDQKLANAAGRKIAPLMYPPEDKKEETKAAEETQPADVPADATAEAAPEERPTEVIEPEDGKVDVDKILRENIEQRKGFDWFDARDDIEDLRITDKHGIHMQGYVIRQPEPGHKWVVCAHGFTSDPRGHASYGLYFYERGYNVILCSMFGHGADEHRYVSMGWFDRYVVEGFVDYICCMDPDAIIVLHGTSMGASTVLLATGLDLPSNVKCCVADCGYTSVWEEYGYVLKHFTGLKFRWLMHSFHAMSKLRGNYDLKKCAPIDAVKQSVTPTLFIHGETDEFVPYFMMDKLYNACVAPKDKLSVPDADHAHSAYIHPKMYWEKVWDFVDRYVD